MEEAGRDTGLESMNVNTCEVKTGEICRGSVTTVLAIGSFFSDGSCWVSLQSWSL